MTDEPEIEVRKLCAYIPVSCCVLTDTTGINYCDHPPPPPPPRPSLRQRLRRHRRELRLFLGKHIGGWLAGEPLYAAWEDITDDD